MAATATWRGRDDALPWVNLIQKTYMNTDASVHGAHVLAWPAALRRRLGRAAAGAGGGARVGWNGEGRKRRLTVAFPPASLRH